MSNTNYSIHGLVDVSICGGEQLIRDVDFHLAIFKTQNSLSKIDIQILPFDQCPDSQILKRVDDYLFTNSGLVRFDTRFGIDISESTTIIYMDSLSIPINLLVELSLLKLGYSFIHGAGLQIGSQNVLFPAPPGTGKTTCVAISLANGAKLYGDDLCIIGHGQIFAYNQDLSLYEHHLKVLNYKDAKLRRHFRKAVAAKRIAKFASFLPRIVQKIINVIFARLAPEAISVSPILVFGANAMATTGFLNSAVTLTRSGTVKVLKEVKANPEIESCIASSLLWHEWHASFHELMLLDAMVFEGKWLHQLQLTVQKIAQDHFNAIPFTSLLIPSDWDNIQLSNALNLWLDDRKDIKLQ